MAVQTPSLSHWEALLISLVHVAAGRGFSGRKALGYLLKVDTRRVSREGELEGPEFSWVACEPASVFGLPKCMLFHIYIRLALWWGDEYRLRGKALRWPK